MRHISSTRAQQAFGDLLESAARAPVAIEKHRKIKAIIAAPDFFSHGAGRDSELAQRRAARTSQALLETGRLIKHQRIAIELLTMPAKHRRALIRHALAVVERWRDERLCSQDYIERWRNLLGLPAAELAKAMTSDLDGWGAALRQNSPWVGALR